MDYYTIAYVPALHRGYLDFFEKYPGTLFLIGDDLKLEYPKLERDIRAMSAEEIKKSLEPFNLHKNIKVLTKENLEGSIGGIKEFIAPDEDISKEFASLYLQNKKVNYVSVFLRWDRHSALKNNTSPVPNRTISVEEFDKEVMNQAFAESRKSSDWWRQIGAVLVKGKKNVLIGHNKSLPSENIHNIFGDPRSNFDYGENFELSKFIHAEAGIIAEAAKKGIALEGAEIYITTFPCPVCAKLIASSGIKKVYYTEGYSLLDAEDVMKKMNVQLIQVKLS